LTLWANNDRKADIVLGPLSASCCSQSSQGSTPFY
jgi:hypothetical protein